MIQHPAIIKAANKKLTKFNVLVGEHWAAQTEITQRINFLFARWESCTVYFSLNTQCSNTQRSPHCITVRYHQDKYDFIIRQNHLFDFPYKFRFKANATFTAYIYCFVIIYALNLQKQTICWRSNALNNSLYSTLLHYFIFAHIICPNHSFKRNKIKTFHFKNMTLILMIIQFLNLWQSFSYSK